MTDSATLRPSVVEERIRFISHKGKQVLLVDVSHCTAEQVAKISKLVPTFVTKQPRGSVLLLGDFTGAQVNRETAERLKQDTVFDRPHLKRSAWVGTEAIPRVLYENIKHFSQRELTTFPNREEALEWLVQE